jgi:hypothetical protein
VAVDEGLVAGQSAQDLARTYAGLSEWSILRHRQNHLSKALVAVQAQRDEVRFGTLTDRVSALVDKAEGLTNSLEKEGAVGMTLAAMREYRASIELLARLTGALDERPQITVNLMQSPEFTQLLTAAMAALSGEKFADARVVVAEAWEKLEAPA